MFLAQELQLLNDFGFVEGGLDSLVVEENYPQAGGCVGLDLRVLKLLFTEEGE